MLRHVLPPKLQTKKKYDEINMKKNNHVNLTVIQKQHWEKTRNGAVSNYTMTLFIFIFLNPVAKNNWMTTYKNRKTFQENSFISTITRDGQRKRE